MEGTFSEGELFVLSFVMMRAPLRWESLLLFVLMQREKSADSLRPLYPAEIEERLLAQWRPIMAKVPEARILKHLMQLTL